MVGVEEDNAVLLEASEVDAEKLIKQEIANRKRKQYKICGCAIITVSLVILAIALGFGLGRKKYEEIISTAAPSEVPSFPAPKREIPW